MGTPPDTLPDDLLAAVKRTPQSLETLASGLHVTPGQALDALLALREKGINLHSPDGKWSLDKEAKEGTAEGVQPYRSRPDGTYVFGAIGDTHLASKYCRLDCLSALYERFAEAGADRVFHGGNWIDGEFPKNKYDLLVHGMDAQLNYLTQEYPSVPGLTTYAVAGNDHEGWYGQREGINIGLYRQMFMERAGRRDWSHLGHMEAFVPLEHAQSGERTMLHVMHPGGGCFTEGADILTRTRGWVPFRELSLDDDVATMTPDHHEFQWQRPRHITNEAYDGPVFDFTARTIKCTVTPNHRFVVRRQETFLRTQRKTAHPEKGRWRHSPQWEVWEAQAIARDYQRQRFAFPTVADSWRGSLIDRVDIPRREPKKYASTAVRHFGSIPIENAAELIGWYVTEGHAAKNGKAVSICQSKRVNPDNHARIVALLRRIGIEPCVTGRDQKDISASSVELVAWLVAECGSGSRNKRLPLWLKNQPVQILRLLLDTMIAGDGWQNGRSRGYRSISKQLADDVSEVAQKCGFGSVMCQRGEDWTVSVRAVQNTPTLNVRPSEGHYAGRIYCCTVPNGRILIRMNGRSFWSHNSAYAVSYTVQQIVNGYEGGEKPAVLLAAHYHKLEHIVTRNVHAIQTGCTQDLTPWARGKKLRYEVGGTLVRLRQDAETGALISSSVEIFSYFNKGWYVGERWSHSGPVVQPEKVGLGA